MTERNLRRVALSLLCRWEEDDTCVNITVPRAAADLEARDRAMLTALVYGTVEHRITLDFYIGTLTASSVASLDPHTLAALRLGVYQLAFMDSIPDHTAVNETVRLARGRGEAAYINGVLREFVRRGKSIALPEYSRNPARHISIKYSIPLPLAKRFVSLFGEDRTVAMFEKFNSRRPLAIKTNTLRTTSEELASRLGATRSEYLPDSLVLSGNAPVTSLDGWEEGLFFVEGVASAIAASALGARPGDRVIDLCSAPGGKSFSVALDMQNRGEIISCDLYENRLRLVESGAARLGIDIIRTEQRDATVSDESLFGRFDRVLCDVPCSGWGVIGGKPDLRYRCFENATRVPELQSAIISASAPYVRVGGTLVYSTCTLNPEENDEIVSAFAASHPEFSFCDFSAGALLSTDGRLTLTPDIHNTDGFFIAKFVRTE